MPNFSPETTAAIHSLSEEEYLSQIEYEHCEYIDGEAVELNLGTSGHSNIQIACGSALRYFLRKNCGGRVFTEIRCELTIDGRPRYYLPDVSVVLGNRPPDYPYLERAPDFIIEIRSPDDRIPALKRKIQHYFENGCRLAWLIIPEERSVLVYRPDAPMHVVLEGHTLNIDGVLPGFEVDVAELFA